MNPAPERPVAIPHLGFVLLSLAAAVISVTLKFAAYRLTNSVGLFSDAIESLANVVAALTALAALCYAARPADRSHPLRPPEDRVLRQRHRRRSHFGGGGAHRGVGRAAFLSPGHARNARARHGAGVDLDGHQLRRRLPAPARGTADGFHRARSRRPPPDDRRMDDPRRGHGPAAGDLDPGAARGFPAGGARRGEHRARGDQPGAPLVRRLDGPLPRTRRGRQNPRRHRGGTPARHEIPRRAHPAVRATGVSSITTCWCRGSCTSRARTIAKWTSAIRSSRPCLVSRSTPTSNRSKNRSPIRTTTRAPSTCFPSKR